MRSPQVLDLCKSFSKQTLGADCSHVFFLIFRELCVQPTKFPNNLYKLKVFKDSV